MALNCRVMRVGVLSHDPSGSLLKKKSRVTGEEAVAKNPDKTGLSGGDRAWSR